MEMGSLTYAHILVRVVHTKRGVGWGWGADTNKPAQDVKREREEFSNERTDWGSKKGLIGVLRIVLFLYVYVRACFYLSAQELTQRDRKKTLFLTPPALPGDRTQGLRV